MEREEGLRGLQNKTHVAGWGQGLDHMPKSTHIKTSYTPPPLLLPFPPAHVKHLASTADRQTPVSNGRHFPLLPIVSEAVPFLRQASFILYDICMRTRNRKYKKIILVI